MPGIDLGEKFSPEPFLIKGRFSPCESLFPALVHTNGFMQHFILKNIYNPAFAAVSQIADKILFPGFTGPTIY